MTRQFSMKLTNMGKTEFDTSTTEDDSTNFDTRRTIVEITGSDGSVAMAQVDRNKNDFTVDLLGSSKYPTIGRTNLTHVVKTTTMTIKGTKVVDNGGGTDPGGGGTDPDPEPTNPYPEGKLLLSATLLSDLRDRTYSPVSPEQNTYTLQLLDASTGNSIDPTFGESDLGLTVSNTQRLVMTCSMDLSILNWSSYYSLFFDYHPLGYDGPNWVMTDETAGIGIFMEQDGGYTTFQIADFPYRNVANSNVTVPTSSDYRIEITRRGFATYLAVTVGTTRTVAKYAFAMVQYSGSRPFGSSMSFNPSYLWGDGVVMSNFYIKNAYLYVRDSIDYTKLKNYNGPEAQYIYADVENGILNYTPPTYGVDNADNMPNAVALDYRGVLPAKLIDVIPFEGDPDKYWFIMMDRTKFCIGVSTLLEAPEIKLNYSFTHGNAMGHKFNYSYIKHSDGDYYWLFDVSVETDDPTVNVEFLMYIMPETDPSWTFGFREDQLGDIYTRATATQSGGWPTTIPTRTVCLKEFSDGLGVVELRCYRKVSTGRDTIELLNYQRRLGNLDPISSTLFTTGNSGLYNYSAIALGWQGNVLHMAVGQTPTARCDVTDEMTVFYETLYDITSASTDLSVAYPGNWTGSVYNGPTIGSFFSNLRYMQCSDWSGFSTSYAKWPETVFYGQFFRDQWVVTSRNACVPLFAAARNQNDDLSLLGLDMPSVYAELNKVYQRTPSVINQVGAFGSDIHNAVDGRFSIFMSTRNFIGGGPKTVVCEYEICQPVSGMTRIPYTYFPGKYIGTMAGGETLTIGFCKKLIGRTTITAGTNIPA